MSEQRLLVIVDAPSQREPETQRDIEQVFAQDVPLNATVITVAEIGATAMLVTSPVRHPAPL
jgi:hypothetical protein